MNSTAPSGTFITLLIVLGFLTRSYSSKFVLYRLPESEFPTAKCLDGSSGSYYLRVANSEQRDKWIIVMESGGWCWDPEDCLRRATTNLGSSRSLKSSLSSEYFQRIGVFDNTPGSSVVAGWNAVYMNYCDGGSFSSDSEGTFDSQKLYFRGRDIRNAIVHSLLVRHDMKIASEIVVAGLSAGGLGVFLGLDSIAAQIAALNNRAVVVGLPDSGVFLDQASPLTQFSPELFQSSRKFPLDGGGRIDYGFAMRQLNKMMRLERGSNDVCVSNSPRYRPCIFAQHIAPYISTPFFLINSMYDTWSIKNVYGSMLAGDRVGINLFGYNTSTAIRKIVSDKSGIATGSKVPRGAFVDSCARHTTTTFQWEGAVRDDTGRSPARAFTEWYEAVVRGKSIPQKRKSATPSRPLTELTTQSFRVNKAYNDVPRARPMSTDDVHGSTQAGDHFVANKAKVKAKPKAKPKAAVAAVDWRHAKPNVRQWRTSKDEQGAFTRPKKKKNVTSQLRGANGFAAGEGQYGRQLQKVDPGALSFMALSGKHFPCELCCKNAVDK